MCTSGSCFGQNPQFCTPCDSATTRCIMNITNNENVNSGQWFVGANFTWLKVVTTKVPISKEIRPGQQDSFDFSQIYNPGLHGDVAICSVYITQVPQISDCHQETRQRTDCQNVTTYRNVSREVCN